MSQFYQWFFNFVIGLITPPMIEALGWGTYAFFAAWCVVAVFWSWLVAPETKDRSLEDMDAVFKTNVGYEEEARKLAIRQELEVVHEYQFQRQGYSEKALHGSKDNSTSIVGEEHVEQKV
jgi:hypothetical protein